MKLQFVLTLAILSSFVISCSKHNSDSGPTGPTTPAAPTIAQFSPQSAPVDSLVTITGTNFNADGSKDIVKFNDTTAVVKSASATQLVVVVPKGASTGKISVTVGTNTVSSAQSFTVTDHWMQVKDFPGTQGLEFAQFAVGNKLYVSNISTQELWQYDIVANTWTQKTKFPVQPVGFILGFAINDKGYFLAIDGITGANLWQYDTLSDKWTQRSHPPVAFNYVNGMVFVISGKAYVGLGDAKTKMWQYDPGTDAWTPKKDYPATAYNNSIGFAIGDKGYAGIGGTNGQSSVDVSSEFYQYDPATDTWTQKKTFPGLPRSRAGAVAINGKGYVGGGLGPVGGPGNAPTDFWQYDAASDTWTQKKDCPANREFPVVLAAANGTSYWGLSSGPGHLVPPGVTTNVYNDFYQYQP